MEQQYKILKTNQNELEDENSSLQQLLEVKEKLLKAQAEQITALTAALEEQLEEIE